MGSEGPSSCKVILAAGIAKSLLAEVQDGLSKLGHSPKLVGLLANNDPAAQMYADWSANTCQENDVIFDLRKVDKEAIEESISAATSDSTVNGIIVYYPIFNARQDGYIKELVSHEKDVKGLCHKYVFNMYQNIRFLDPPANAQKSVLPCTPLAVVKVLEYVRRYNSILPYGNRLFGRTITVINRSEVVGRPLAALLANDGACVYSVAGWSIKDCLPLSDVVVSGVPGEAFKVPVDLIRDGAVCINFSSEKNFNGPEVKEKASIYVLAIGKVTIAVLLRNLLVSCHISIYGQSKVYCSLGGCQILSFIDFGSG